MRNHVAHDISSTSVVVLDWSASGYCRRVVERADPEKGKRKSGLWSLRSIQVSIYQSPVYEYEGVLTSP
jgi:hypothetical protein